MGEGREARREPEGQAAFNHEGESWRRPGGWVLVHTGGSAIKTAAGRTRAPQNNAMPPQNNAMKSARLRTQGACYNFLR
jgi:hypothetical protein